MERCRLLLVTDYPIADGVCSEQRNGGFIRHQKIWEKDFPSILDIGFISEPFAGKEKSFREERLEAIQKKEEEKWKRRSLPSAQNEDSRSGFKSMQVKFSCSQVFQRVSRCSSRLAKSVKQISTPKIGTACTAQKLAFNVFPVFQCVPGVSQCFKV